MGYGKEFTKGIIKENPNLVVLLGMCPTLAITTQAINGIGMGLATTFVLICSNMVISALKKIIPEQVRLPCFIVIIAGFVTAIEMLMGRYFPDLYKSLGIYLPLITVNCIILGRAEVFASKNNVLASICDGAGMGIGFTLSLTLMGTIREIMGLGTIFSGTDFKCELPITPMGVFIIPVGGFFTLGLLIALINKISNKRPPEKAQCDKCGGCEK